MYIKTSVDKNYKDYIVGSIIDFLYDTHYNKPVSTWHSRGQSTFNLSLQAKIVEVGAGLITARVTTEGCLFGKEYTWSLTDIDNAYFPTVVYKPSVLPEEDPQFIKSINSLRASIFALPASIDNSLLESIASHIDEVESQIFLLALKEHKIMPYISAISDAYSVIFGNKILDKSYNEVIRAAWFSKESINLQLKRNFCKFVVDFAEQINDRFLAMAAYVVDISSNIESETIEQNAIFCLDDRIVLCENIYEEIRKRF